MLSRLRIRSSYTCLVQLYNSMSSSLGRADLLLRAILHQQHFCIVHIVEITHGLDYPDVPVPVILSKLHPTSEGNRNSQHVNLHRSTSFLPNLKNLLCFVGVLLLSGPRYMNYLEPLRSTQLTHLMSHRYFLGLPQGIRSEIVVVPDYFFIFDDGIQLATASTFALDFFVKESISSRHDHLPPVFVIPSSSDVVSTGWFVCHYCGGKEIYDFECADETSCVESLWQMYRAAIQDGKNVGWVINWLPIKSIVETFDRRKYCPMTLKTKKSKCYSRKLELAAGVLFAELNGTAIMKAAELQVIPVRLPSMHTAGTLRDSSLELVLTGHSPAFLFITSDSVTKVDTSPFGYLTSAFNFCVWYLMCVAVATIAIILSTYELSRIGLNALMAKIIQTYVVLVDQAHFREGSARRNVSRSVLVATWLISALFLSVSYKCIFKSHYIFEPQYQTRWKELIEISNFTLYFGVHVENKSRDHSCESTYYKSCDEMNLVTRVGFSDRGACALTSLARMYPHINYDWDKNFTRIYKEGFWNIVDNLHIVCMNDIETVISEELIRPRTAFVSPSNHFSIDWRLFQGVNRQKKHVKFAFSGNAEEPLLKFHESIGFPAGLNKIHKSQVPARLKALLTSGIYQLWEKWETLRDIFNTEASIKQDHIQFLALSLQGSDIYVVFLVLFTCESVLLCMFMFQHMYCRVCRNRLYKIRAE